MTNLVNKVSNKTFRDFMAEGSNNLQYGINYHVNQKDNGKFFYQESLKFSINQSRLIQNRNKQFDDLMKSNDDFESICLTVTATSPFISGLGAEHITETGIYLHHTYGVPFLPGTMLKGVVNQWLEKASKMDESFIPLRQLTGLEENEGSENSQEEENQRGSKGLLIFHDCFFSQLELKKDIMTPHFGSYYGSSKNFVEEDRPVPVKFNAVEFKGNAHLWVSWDKSTKIDDKEKLSKIIAKAIEETALGAKTNVGYGRFKATINKELSGVL